MKKHRIALLAFTLTSVAALASANAADMYITGPAGPGGYKDAPHVASWAGFYAGVNGGYGWSASNGLVDPDDHVCFRGVSPSGGFGGGQIGYNWQGLWNPNLVLGLEADIQGGGIDEKKSEGASFFSFESENSRLDYFGTVRGRLGYAFGSSLLYATGGFAYGGLHNEFDGVVASKNGLVLLEWKNNGTATGYVAGGGYEYKFNPAWSLKAEYQYIDLGRNDMTHFFSPGHVVSICFDDTCKNDAFHTVRAGLNYHFGTAYEPLK
jgi:outer membrane immunogenic protein